MKEVRNIKLDLLMGNQNPIVDLFNKITDGIKIINTNVYNKDGLEFIYFVENSQKEDEWIFYQDVKNEEFWCNYSLYWSLFESNFDLEYEEIQSITIMLLGRWKKHSKERWVHPTSYKNMIKRRWKKHSKERWVHQVENIF